MGWNRDTEVFFIVAGRNLLNRLLQIFPNYNWPGRAGATAGAFLHHPGSKCDPLPANNFFSMIELIAKTNQKESINIKIVL